MRQLLLVGLCRAAGTIQTAHGAYILDDKRSLVGAYAYLDEYTTDFSPLPRDTGFDGDGGPARPLCPMPADW